MPQQARKNELQMSDEAKRPPCKYGIECYRVNPSHLAQYSHPETPSTDSEELLLSSIKKHLAASTSDMTSAFTSSNSTDTTPSVKRRFDSIEILEPSKRQRRHNSSGEDALTSPKNGYYLTSVKGLHDSVDAISLKDILRWRSKELQASLHLNFMVRAVLKYVHRRDSFTD